MANLDRIVSVAIALRTAGVQQQSFSDLMLMGVHTGAGRVGIITAADDLLDNSDYTGITVSSDLYKAAQVAFSQIPGPSQVFIGRRDSAEAIVLALAACRAANDDWYGFSDVSHTEADLPLAAAWAEANEKLYLAAISDVDVGASTGVEPATTLMTGNFFRTAWWYTPDPDTFPEVAIAARCFTTPPGGETWALKQLAAVPSTKLSETQYVNITAKNGNTFEPFRNLSVTQNGITAGGERIDVIRFRDWLCEEIRTRVFQMMVNAEKVPYTDEGIAMVRQAIEGALALGVRRQGIAPPTVDVDNNNRVIPSYTISMPALSQISSIDKAARILRDVRFTARLAGAIHAVQINGTLTYDNIG